MMQVYLNHITRFFDNFHDEATQVLLLTLTIIPYLSPPHHSRLPAQLLCTWDCFIHTYTFSMFQLDHRYQDTEGTLERKKECTELNVSLNSQKKSSRNLTF